MFPLWEVAIAPVLDAAGARRVVEIGALRGETTVLMLERPRPGRRAPRHRPGAGVRPAPSTSAQFPGRYVFHRRLSLDVLPDARADGRRAHRRRPQLVHGLQRAEAAAPRRPPARRAAAGARSCTTSAGRTAGATSTTTPRQIPDEYRQPYAPGGHAARARAELLDTRRPEPDDVQRRGGRRPRNGVMTALDDFMAEHDRPLRGSSCSRSTSGSPSSSRRSGSTRQPELAARARPARERATGKHELLERRRGRPPAGDDLPAQRLSSSAQEQVDRATARATSTS